MNLGNVSAERSNLFHMIIFTLYNVYRQLLKMNFSLRYFAEGKNSFVDVILHFSPLFLFPSSFTLDEVKIRTIWTRILGTMGEGFFPPFLNSVMI